jgi:hypothetical protein
MSITKIGKKRDKPNLSFKHKPRQFELNTILSFGKYKGKNTTVEKAIKTDSNYIHWCLKNVLWAKFSDKVLRLLSKYPEIKSQSRPRGYSNSGYSLYGDFDERSYSEKREDWPGAFDSDDLMSANPYSPLDDGW